MQVRKHFPRNWESALNDGERAAIASVEQEVAELEAQMAALKVQKLKGDSQAGAKISRLKAQIRKRRSTRYRIQNAATARAGRRQKH